MQYSIQDITKDIEKGKCVLFLGPELLVNNEGKYYKAFFKELADKSAGVYRYFPRSNLFSIAGEYVNLSRKKLITNLISYYEQAGDEIILNLISQIPFSLIINVSPDLSLNKIFEENNYKPYFDAYFPDPESNKIQSPARESPVIYNIFGSITDSQSLIITHDDLFKRIKELEQKDSIPENIHKHLKKAESFIFLGMKFDTWYYQLLLSILDIDKSPSVRISAPNEIDDDTVSVMNSYFQIIFELDNPLTLIQGIYDEISGKHPALLRKPTVAAPKGAVYISYAWNDETDPKRETLINMVESELYDQFLIKVFRDRNVLTLQDSIESFMNRIGRGKAVMIVVSDKYLKSEYCMYEAWQVYKNSHSEKRVFLMTLPDIDLSEDGKAGYIKYWVDRKNAIDKTISTAFSNDYPAAEKLISKSKNIIYIYLFIDEFLKIIDDTVGYRMPQNFSGMDAEKAVIKNYIKDVADKLKTS